jgi:putative ABC transport system permease protein
MILDYVKFAYRGIKKRRLRSYLTMIGIFIGIAAVVALISLGQGLQVAIEEQFEKAGADKVIITPGRGAAAAFGGIGAADNFYDRDVDIVGDTRGVDKVGGLLYKEARVEFKDEIQYTFVIGVPDELDLEDFAADIEHGRNLEEGDGYKALVGYLIYHDDFFEKSVRIRGNIKIEDEDFEVVGSVDRVGNRQDDTQIYIPVETAQEGFDEEGFSTIVARAKEGVDPGEVADEITKELRKDRDLKEGEEDFSVQTFEQLMETFSNILGVVQTVIVGIAAISLLVGGIGIMNTMYMTVLERTKEIGVMKAIGAKNSHIMQIFLIESGIYGLIGGAIGVAIGIGLAKMTEFIAFYALGTTLLRASIAPTLIIGALLFSFFVGILSGVAPAFRASKLRPVAALRYE